MKQSCCEITDPVTMKSYTKYFMWKYQHIYHNNIQSSAKELFKSLSKRLEPGVFLIGIRREEQKDCHPICVEPEKCGIDVNLFASVDKLAESIYSNDPRRDIVENDPAMRPRFADGLKGDCLRKAVKQLVDKNFEGRNKISFVSQPEMLGIYEIFVILQLDEDIYNSFHPLSRSEQRIDEFKTINVYRSLIDALGHIFLEEAFGVLHRPKIGVYYDTDSIQKETLLRTAATKFVDTVVFGINQSVRTFDLFNICNYISSLKYEGDSSVGKMVICKADHPNIDIVLKLTKPVQLRNHKGVRKLLEIASDELHLHSDGTQIMGLSRLVGDYNPQREDLFVVSFTGSHKWELLHYDQIVMNVKDTNPGFQHPKINKSQFDDLLERTFQNIPSKNRTDVWRMVNESIKQKHGALIIITSEAEEESKRLEQQSTKIEPTLLDEDLIRKVTSIDGAVLLDPSGVCHSIGVILDGLSVPKGDPARGSRFNSAVRYVEMKKGKCVAVIVSEDGMADLYPKLKLRIEKSEIIKHLNRLISAVGKETVDYDECEPLMLWFIEKEFYLSQEECDKINQLKTTFEEKWIRDRSARYIFHDLQPNPEMNDLYFLNKD